MGAVVGRLLALRWSNALWPCDMGAGHSEGPEPSRLRAPTLWEKPVRRAQWELSYRGVVPAHRG